MRIDRELDAPPIVGTYHVIKNPFLIGCIEPFSSRLDYGIINLAAKEKFLSVVVKFIFC